VHQVEQNVVRIADLISNIRDAVGEGAGRTESLAGTAEALNHSVGEFRVA
jgi:methyl-accepting chemotaxis protein